MPDYSPEPRTYELMTILSPEVSEDDLPGATEEIGGYITSASGDLDETLIDSPWGRRRLAYPIRHAGRDLRDGFYTLYHFSIEPKRVGDIERELKLNTSVIRYLMTRYEPVPPEELSEEDAEIAAEDEAAAAYAAAQAAGEVESDPPAETPEPEVEPMEATTTAVEGGAPVEASEPEVQPTEASTEGAEVSAEASAEEPVEPAGESEPAAEAEEPSSSGTEEA